MSSLIKDVYQLIIQRLYWIGDIVTAARLIIVLQKEYPLLKTVQYEKPVVYEVRVDDDSCTTKLDTYFNDVNTPIYQDWGDDSLEQLSNNTTKMQITHKYKSTGVYKIRIFTESIYKISNLRDAVNMLSLGKLTNCGKLFMNNTIINTPLRLDTSNITDMSYMFKDAINFNQPLKWDTSQVTNNVFYVFGCYKVQPTVKVGYISSD